MYNDPIDHAIREHFRRIESSIEVTDRENNWITGMFNSDGTLNPDPQYGLSDGFIWGYPADTRAQMVMPLGDRMLPFKRVLGKHFTTAFNDKGERIAFAPMNDGINAPSNSRVYDKAIQQAQVTTNEIIDLHVRQPDAAFAGLNVCIEAGLSIYGYVEKQHVDVTAGLAPTSGKRRWALIYEDTDKSINVSTTGSVETGVAANDMLLGNGGNTGIAALENLAISPGWIPLAGIVLDNGQTAVDATTRIAAWCFVKTEMPDAGSGTDADAVHVNVANEIDGITEKTSLDADDLFIIEDSADSGNKKKVKKSNLPAGGGNIAQSYLGYDVIGGSNVNMVTQTSYIKKITVASTSFLMSIDAYIHQTSTSSVSSIMCYLMTDNAGAPGDVMAIGTFFAAPAYFDFNSGNARWLTMSITAKLVAGDYWIAVNKADANGVIALYYDGSGSDYTQTHTGKWVSDGVLNTGISGTPSSGSNKYSIRASVIS